MAIRGVEFRVSFHALFLTAQTLFVQIADVIGLVDSIAEIAMGILPLTVPEADALARRYRCVQRTIYRMRSRGVDVRDPLAIAAHLAVIKAPSVAMLEAIAKELEARP
jgi:hypothetical protein